MVKRILVVVSLLLTLMMLTACGGGSTSPTNSPQTSANDDGQTDPVDSAIDTMETIEASGDDTRSGFEMMAESMADAGYIARDGFEVTISGAVEVTLPPGYVQWTAEPAFDEVMAATQELAFLGFQQEWTVLIVLPAEIEPGTYEFSQDFSGYGQQPTASVEPFVTDFERIAEMPESFETNVSGTITIDAVGETISGSFSFTAEQYTDIDDDGELLSGEQISVTGTFRDVPLTPDE